MSLVSAHTSGGMMDINEKPNPFACIYLTQENVTSLIQMLFLGILPAGILMWVGNRIRVRSAEEKTAEYWLFFLLGGLGSSIITLTIARSISEYAFSLLIPGLLPIMFGFAAALGLHVFQGRHLSITKTPLAWLGWDQNGKLYTALFIIEVILLGISIQVTDMNRIADMNPRWLGSMLYTISFLFIPWIGVVLSALLIRKLFLNDHPLNWRIVSSTLFMVAILFLMVGYQGMIVSLWDVATDGLGWVFLWMTTSTIGIGSAMLIAWSMPRKHLWAAILFALTVPWVLWQSHNLANYDRNHEWGTKPVIITERRAKKIDRAIQRYYNVNNEYPKTLSNLTPSYLLYVPTPFIIPGLDWCYEGGNGHYRFGYVYREYFSMPASVRIHSFAGEPSDTNWKCQDEADMYSKPLGF